MVARLRDGVSQQRVTDLTGESSSRASPARCLPRSWAMSRSLRECSRVTAAVVFMLARAQTRTIVAAHVVAVQRTRALQLVCSVSLSVITVALITIPFAKWVSRS